MLHFDRVITVENNKLVFAHDLFGVESETTTGIRGLFEWADRERYLKNSHGKILEKEQELPKTK